MDPARVMVNIIVDTGIYNLLLVLQGRWWWEPSIPHIQNILPLSEMKERMLKMLHCICSCLILEVIAI
jgi:hypothetical protein